MESGVLLANINFNINKQLNVELPVTVRFISLHQIKINLFVRGGIFLAISITESVIKKGKKI